MPTGAGHDASGWAGGAAGRHRGFPAEVYQAGAEEICAARKLDSLPQVRWSFPAVVQLGGPWENFNQNGFENEDVDMSWFRNAHFE